MSELRATTLPLQGLKLISRERLSDHRGFLSRLFCMQQLTEQGWPGAVSQINHTSTLHAGAIRGMHYQRAPFCEVKLVSVIRGEVWDVAVDLRSGSSTFLQWHAEILSADNHRALLIPEGFAHGFQALSDNVEMLYCHSAPYQADAEAGLSPFDPALDIAWPLPVSDLSDRDRSHPPIGRDFTGVIWP